MLRPTETLVFKIHSWIGLGMRAQWRDEARGPLETRLNDIVAGLLAGAATIRQQRLEREEEQRRRRAEETTRAKQEEARREGARHLAELVQLVTHWRQAADIRAYVKAIRVAARKGVVVIEDGRLDGWVKWALGRADQLDPLAAGHPIGVERTAIHRSTGGSSKHDVIEQ
jgi:hypothetical protein